MDRQYLSGEHPDNSAHSISEVQFTYPPRPDASASDAATTGKLVIPITAIAPAKAILLGRSGIACQAALSKALLRSGLALRATSYLRSTLGGSSMSIHRISPTSTAMASSLLTQA
jgi:hypothetical protein